MRDTAIIKIKSKTINDVRFKGTYKEFKIWFKNYYVDVDPFIQTIIKISSLFEDLEEKGITKEIFSEKMEKFYSDDNYREFVGICDDYHLSRIAYDKMLNDEFNFKWLNKVLPNLFYAKGWDYEIIDI